MYSKCILLYAENNACTKTTANINKKVHFNAKKNNNTIFPKIIMQNRKQFGDLGVNNMLFFYKRWNCFKEIYI